VRSDLIRTSRHATLYDGDESATAGCDENANTDDRVLKTPTKNAHVWFAGKPLAGSDWKLSSLQS
jgi:hypothetical protein